ncbi:efflux RND transporter periplasmic adaptor subunit [Albibacterium bauzanense]|uniref:RND family efflux transporter MFP subunit n=1 Tax=Albibacterium bauzanense TaxID=653929 RepID=A0A4R1LPB1_9SPHI|nr:efflux RND transporter periplasmic adaptor subunit [Albibacterium bauzanense]TCK80916.1 RND family efflux transporter MFP subunit [Albibacterium bauzanense]
MKAIIIINIFLILFLVSCRNEQPNNRNEENPIEDHEEIPNSVFLTDEQIKAVGIQLGQIEQKSLSDGLKINGELSVPNQNKANATTLYPGIIKEIYIQPGSAVKKGQRIASITNADYIKMQEDYLNLTTESTLAETEYRRQKELYEGKAGALKNLQRAETEFRALSTRKASLKQQLQMMGINTSDISNGNLVTSLYVLAPISGVLSNSLVQIGSYVDTSTPIAEIIDNSKIHVDLHVYEKDLPRFKVGQDLDFYLTNNQEKRYSARIFSTGSSFEDNSKTIIVHAEVTGGKVGLIDGMNIIANVGFDKSTVDAVPTEAVVNQDGKDYIFIVQDHEDESKNDLVEDEHQGITFIRVPVITTKSDVGYTQITPVQEIDKNAKIANKGAFFILAKMMDTGDSHGH